MNQTTNQYTIIIFIYKIANGSCFETFTNSHWRLICVYSLDEYMSIWLNTIGQWEVYGLWWSVKVNTEYSRIFHQTTETMIRQELKKIQVERIESSTQI